MVSSGVEDVPTQRETFDGVPGNTSIRNTRVGFFDGIVFLIPGLYLGLRDRRR